jgi:hypothetical protein
MPFAYELKLRTAPQLRRVRPCAQRTKAGMRAVKNLSCARQFQVDAARPPCDGPAAARSQLGRWITG